MYRHSREASGGGRGELQILRYRQNLQACGRLTAPPCPVMPVLSASPAAAHQHTIVRTLLVFCLLAGGFAAAQTAAQSPRLSSLQPETARGLQVQAVPAELYRDGVSGIDGLNGAVRMVVSADGSLLFVAARNDDALSVWQVNAENGTLAQSALYKDGVPSDGLDTPSALALSPDGSLLFVTAESDNALSVWQVDAEAGTLAQSALYQDGSGGIEGLREANSVAPSPDGSLLFAGGSNGSEFVLSVWRVDAGAGTLVQINLHRMRASDLVFSANGRLLFVTDAVSNALSVWQVNSADGALTRSARYIDDDGRTGLPDGADGEFDGLDGVQRLALNTGENLLFTTAQIDNALSVWQVDAEAGTLTQSTLHKDGSRGIDGLDFPTGLAPSPDGSLLFVTAGNDDALSLWQVNAEAGTLMQSALYRDSSSFDGLDSPSGPAFSPDGSLLFVPAFLDDTLSSWYITRGVVPMEEIMLTAQVGSAAPGNATLVITAVQGEQMIAKEATLMAGQMSATAVFEAGALGSGHWTFQVTATRPPNALMDTESVRTRVQVVQPPLVALELTVPEMPLMRGAALMITVTVAQTPMTDLDVQVSLTGEGVTEEVQTVTLTMSTLSRDLTFTVPENAPLTLMLATQTTAQDVFLAEVTDVTAAVMVIQPPIPNLLSLQLEAASLRDTADLSFIRAYQDCEIGLCGLGAARHIAVSADGSQLFVTGDTDNAAVTFVEVDKNAGTLRRLNLYRALNIDGLAGASALALSPDNSLLFITAATDNALSVWRVDAVAGTLGQTDLHEDGEGGIDGLDTPSDLAVSPDGRLVFVVSEGDDALSVWQVDAEASTPTITQSALYKNGSDDIDCLDGASALALSPDGSLLFVAAATDDALSVWRVNATDGTLELAETYKNGAPGINGLDGASNLALSPDGRLLFAASETGDALSVWQVDADASTPIITQSALYFDDDGTAALPAGADAEFDGLDGASDITLSSDGNLLFVTARIDDALSVWDVDAAAGTLIQTGLYRDGSGGIDGLDGAFAVALSPDDSLLFVTGNDDDTLSLWRSDLISQVPSSEALMIRAQVDIAAPGNATLVITAMQGDQIIEKEATLMAGDMSAAAVFEADTLGLGRWTFEVTETRPPAALNTGSVQAEVQVVPPPLGLSSLQAETDAPSPRPQATADLDFIRAYQDSEAGLFGLDDARGIAVSADGSQLFVTGDVDNAAVTFVEVDRDTGRLRRLNLYRAFDADGLGGASALALSPDDSLLFITAATDNALSVWRVNAGAGTLAQTDVHRDGEGNIDGLDGPSGLAVSPDESLLFVTSANDNALSVWRVNAAASTLGQTQLLKDESGGIDGLGGAADTVVSPDGHLLFVAAETDDALSVWRVNAEAGTVEQTDLHKDGSSSINTGLDGASDLALSPDGRLLFAASETGDALSVWQVDAEAGTIAQSALYLDDDGIAGLPDGANAEFDGLDGASDLATSADGHLLFVTAFNDDALSVWEVDAAVSTPTTITQSTLYRDESSDIDGLDGAFAVALSPNDNLLFVTGSQDDSLSVWSTSPILRVPPSAPITIRAQVGNAVPETVTLVISAMQGSQVITEEATLLAGQMSAAAVFDAGTLGPGRWTFEVTATRPPTDVEPLRAQVLVGQPQSVTLELTAPEIPLMQGAELTITVAATPAPTTQLNVRVNLTGQGVTEVIQIAILTMGSPSRELTFTVPEDAPETLQLATQTTADEFLATVTEVTATVAVIVPLPRLLSLQLEAESLQDTADLDFIRAFRDGETSFAALGDARNIAVNRFANRLFVTGENAVAVAGVARNAGTLRQINLYRDDDVDGLDGASALALSPDDSLLFITAATDNALSVWRVNTVADTLEQTDLHKDGVENLDGLDGVSDLVLSSDGSLVFVVSERDDALSVWQVDASALTPTITQSALYRNDSDDIDGLDGASGIALSPNGRLLFVAATIDDALSVWRVNASSGTLELAETYKNGAPGIDGLDGASDLAVSPDRRLLFAASETGDALSVWQVNTTSDTITHSALYLDDDGIAGLPDGADAEFDGLDGISDITLSSDGGLLFVTARVDDTLSVWSVNAADGTLLQTGLYRDGSGGIDGLDGAFAVALSRNDSLLFVTGNDDNTLSFWRTAPISAVLSSEPITIRAQVDSALPVTPTLVITAMQDAQMIAREATLLAGEMSAAAVFEANTLGSGRWTFQVTVTRPPGTLDTGSVRAEVLVVQLPVQLLSLQPEAESLQPQATADLSFIRAYRDGRSGFAGFDAARNIALNRDGNRLYVTGDVGNSAVTVARVDKNAGTLQRLNLYRDSNIDGLGGASVLALSPDNSMLFIIAATDNALSVWRTNEPLGTIEQTDLHRDGEEDIDGLDTPSDLAISPDGRLMFVVSEGDDALSVWQVNPGGGTISQTQLFEDGSSGIDGLNGASALAISPDGSLLFVAAEADDALSVWRVNTAARTAEQTDLHKHAAGNTEGLDGASDLAVSLDGRLLFAASETGDALSVWQVNAASTPTISHSALYLDDDGIAGLPDGADAEFDGLDGVSDITLSSDGGLLFVTARVDDTLSVWEVDVAAGTLMQSTLYRDGSGGANGLDGAFDVELSPDDSLLFVTGNDDDTLGLWRVAPISRVLFSEAITIRAQVDSAMPMTATLVIAATQGEQMITGEATLLAREMSATAVFEAGMLGPGRWTFEVTATRPPDVPLNTGSVRTEVLVVQLPLRLSSLQAEPDAPLRPQAAADLSFIRAYRDCDALLCALNAARHIAVNSDASRLYVTGDTGNAAVTVAEVDKEAGTLRRLNLYRDSSIDGLGGASALALSPDDSLLFITATVDNALSVWRADAGAGTLARTDLHKDGQGGLDGLDTPSDLAVSPDGRLVFVVSQGDDALSVWQVDAGAGTLMQSALYKDGSGGIDGLDGASGIALSPDGSLLFVAAQADDALSVWFVNAADGTVEQTDLHKHAASNIQGLDGASDLALSPDGRLLFAASETGDALGVWQVNARVSTPTITHGALYLDDDETAGLPEGADAEFDGLDGVSDITLSSDGNLLFVTARTDDALSVWEVDAATDTLAQSALHQDGINGIDGLDGAFAVALSQDDSLLFVTGNDVDSLGLWRIAPIPRALPMKSITIRAQLNRPVLVTVTLVIAAMQGEQMITREATLLAGEREAAAVFEGGTLGLGRWTFQVSATRPPNALLDVESVRAQMLVVPPPVTLELTVPGMPLRRGAEFMITVAAMPMPATQLSVQVSLTGRSVTEIMQTATLTMETPSRELTFTVPGNAPGTLILATLTTADVRQVTVTEAAESVTVMQPPRLSSLQAESNAPLQPQATADLGFIRAYRDCDASLCGLATSPAAARNIALSTDGSLLFVTGDNDGAVTSVRVDKDTGTLRRLNLYRDSNIDGLGGASALALSPDNSLLFITAATDNALSVWRVGAASGTLEQTDLHKDGEGNLDGLDTPSDLAISPDGRLVFVVSKGDDALSVWQVDTEASNPTITQSALYKDGSGGLDGLDGASGIAISPDGSLLFVAAQADDALSVWFVNAADGTVEQTDLHKHAASNTEGLDGASDLALSPDGRLLFAVSQTRDALSVWQVDASALTPTITHSALYLDDDGAAGLPAGADAEFDGLDGISDITLSSDGSLLFAAARIDDALSVWEVNAEAGTLTQSALHQDGINGIDGLNGAFAVALSPDDSLLFVTGNGDDTLSVWRIAAIVRVLSIEPITIRAQVDSTAPMTAALVIAARLGEQIITEEATFSAGDMSAAAVFGAGALGVGRWTFEVTASRPPGALNTGPARAEALVVHLPVTLELTVPDMPLMQNTTIPITVTATPAPAAELNVRVSLTGRRVTEVIQAATLTMETPSRELTFTVPENPPSTLRLATQTTADEFLAVTEAIASVAVIRSVRLALIVSSMRVPLNRSFRVTLTAEPAPPPQAELVVTLNLAVAGVTTATQTATLTATTPSQNLSFTALAAVPTALTLTTNTMADESRVLVTEATVMVTAVVIQSLDFVEPEGVNTDDLVFALRHFMLCADADGCSADEAQILMVNLPPLRLGVDITAIDTQSILTAVAGDSADAQGIVILLQYLSQVPIDLLLPLSEGDDQAEAARQETLDTIRNILEIE